MARAFKACVISDCNGDANAAGTALGYCRSHYRRFRRHGDPLAGGTPMGERRRWIDAHSDYAGDDCIEWPFSVTESGYGQFKIEGHSTLASRVMCEAAHGQPPSPEHQAAHSCGNGTGGCMNPRHLRWATRLENEADKIEHGTLMRGERQGGSKLTTEVVMAIREQAGVISHGKLAAHYGVSRSQIGRVINGKRWAWLT